MSLAEIAAEVRAWQDEQRSKRDTDTKARARAEAEAAVQAVLVYPDGRQLRLTDAGLAPLEDDVPGGMFGWSDGTNVLLATRGPNGGWAVALGARPNSNAKWHPRASITSLADLAAALT